MNSGTWYLTSAMDPRWNCHGHYVGWGITPLPAECSGRLAELESALGSRPTDLHFSYELETVSDGPLQCLKGAARVRTSIRRRPL